MGDAPDPRVSVVFLSYNQQDYVVQAIRSVVDQQTTVPFEVVVADDCSTDSTRTLLAAAVGNDDRVRILPTPVNLGMQANLRRALNTTRGDYIALLEGDDYWTDPRKLERQVEYLDEHPDCSAVTGLTEIDTGDAKRMLFSEGFLHTRVRSRIDSASALQGIFPHASALMYRARVFPTTPEWFDGLPAADWLLANMLAMHGDIGVIEDVVSTYRKNQQSTWTPRPQLERRLAHLAGVQALGANVSHVGPTYARILAKSHSDVAGVAFDNGQRQLAASHWLASIRADPRTFLESAFKSARGRFRRPDST